MVDWFLIIALGGVTGVSDIKHMKMTEPQCRAAIEALSPLRGRIGAVCIGPNGEKISLDGDDA